MYESQITVRNCECIFCILPITLTFLYEELSNYPVLCRLEIKQFKIAKFKFKLSSQFKNGKQFKAINFVQVLILIFHILAHKISYLALRKP